LQFSPANISFGHVTIGQSETQLITLTNTGKTSVTVSAITAGNSQFSVTGMKLPLVIAAAQTVSVNVKFTPSKSAWVGGTITFTNTSSVSKLQLNVGGTGATSESLTLAPKSLSFGKVAVGSSATLSVVLTNAVSWKVTLSGAQASGDGFSVSGAKFPVVLAAGKSVTLNVKFAPKDSGVAGGSIFVSGAAFNVPLTGTGTSSTTTTGKLSVSPTTMSFGSVDVGSSTNLSAKLTATGASVTISSASSSNSQYTIAESFPLTINAGQSLSVNVAFAPTKTGSSNGTLTFNSNASTTKTTESVSGTGITPKNTVTLSWKPSNSSSVVGYNVYRGTKAGSYSKINSALDANTSYSDETVSSGVTYYYTATAVNASGEESYYSKAIQVAVP